MPLSLRPLTLTPQRNRWHALRSWQAVRSRGNGGRRAGHEAEMRRHQYDDDDENSGGCEGGDAAAVLT